MSGKDEIKVQVSGQSKKGREGEDMKKDEEIGMPKKEEKE